MRIPGNPFRTLVHPSWGPQRARGHRACALAHGLRFTVIPPHMHAAITAYVVERRLIDRRPPGRFLLALLQNDLRAAVTLAEVDNHVALPSWIGLLEEYAPAECWGSVEKVTAWLEGVETT